MPGAYMSIYSWLRSSCPNQLMMSLVLQEKLDNRIFRQFSLSTASLESSLLLFSLPALFWCFNQNQGTTTVLVKTKRRVLV